MLFRKSNKAKAAKDPAAPAEAKAAKVKGKKKPAKESQAVSSSGISLAISRKTKPLYRKPQADLFTVMLVISLLAIILGIVFLSLEMNEYQWKLAGMIGGLLSVL